MKRLLLIALVCLAVWPATSASAETLAEVLARGNDAYLEDEFDSAALAYEQLVSAGVDDADVHFNLGTSYARAGKLGRAVLSFERSLRVRPTDEGAARSLKSARELLTRSRAERDGEATFDESAPFSETIVRRFSEPFLAYGLLALVVLLFGLLVAKPRLRSDSARTGVTVAAVFASVLLLLFGLGLIWKTGAFQAGEPAVVVGADVSLRSAPDPRAEAIGEVSEGDRVKILRAHDGYVEVLWADDKSGWASEAEVISIALQQSSN